MALSNVLKTKSAFAIAALVAACVFAVPGAAFAVELPVQQIYDGDLIKTPSNPDIYIVKFYGGKGQGRNPKKNFITFNGGIMPWTFGFAESLL